MFRKKRKLTFYQKKSTITPKIVREVLSFVFITFLAIFLALVFVSAIGMQVKVVGDSMEPTLGNSQSVLVNKLVYKIIGPSKGDIIVFLPNGNTNSHYYVKRVVAVPGDKVQIVDGVLYVNGTVVDDDKDKYDKMEDAGIAANEIKLGSGEYFVLGDNRNSSEDSRSANIGVITTKMMIGKVWYKLGGKGFKGGPVFN